MSKTEGLKTHNKRNKQMQNGSANENTQTSERPITIIEKCMKIKLRISIYQQKY
jgi:hypothetical protein